ncbi:MAG TPA: DUF3772 domain-containing protein, partial [Rhodanobacter sp.]
MPTLLRYLFVLLLTLPSGVVLAQDAPDAGVPATAPALTPTQTLTQLRAQLDDIKAAVDAKKTDVPLSDLRNRALAVQQQAEQLTSTLSPQSASLQARLDVLGPAPVKGAPPESPQLSAQRRQLGKAKSDMDGQVKQTNSLGTEASQLAAHVAELRRDQFQTQLASRTATPFSRAFWVDPAKAFPDDMARAKQLGSDALAAMRLAWQPPNRTPFVLCLIIAALLLSVGRWLIERSLVYVTTNRMPAGRLRRSALAIAVTLAYMLAIGLSARFVYLALNWNDLLSADLDELARKLVRLVTFAAFMTG